ncbi:MAG: FAD-dependent oxidoreductase, partial [Rhizobiales bacterium]|nr:FAD-dependent oxidoreductase [Hyphomicrobiales bacterium]
MLGFDQRAATLHDTDILVVGGGAAGVAAAVTAARQGLRVTLVEKYGFCGGGAVAGMSGTICGMYEASDAPDSRPVQVVHGFLDEFVRLMEARGGLAPPVRYGKTFTRVHDPLIWRDVADALLEEAGVTVVYHAMATSVLVEGGERVEGAVIFTKEGPLRVRAKLTVDASGDADLVAMAGFPSFVGQNGKVQNPTMIFRLLGVDVDRFVGRYGTDTIMPDEISELIREKNVGNEYRLPRAKIWLFPTTRPNELLCNCTRIVGKDGRELNVLYAKDFTEAEIEGRKQIREYARFFRDNLAGCANSVINDRGVQVGVRQTRQAKGVAMLRNVDVTQGTKFKDGIARSPWPIELHTGTKPKVEWLINDFYEVPYGCFVPERGEGLLVAGRCL